MEDKLDAIMVITGCICLILFFAAFFVVMVKTS